MTVIDWIGWAGLASLPAFLLLDLVHRARRYPTDRRWRRRSLLVGSASFALAIGYAWSWGYLLGDFHLLDGAGLGTWGGALAGIVVYGFGHYWYHRAAHASDRLWRAHQFHHSAESLDAFGAQYIHPLDLLWFTTISSLVFYPLLGLTPEAGAVAAAFVAFCAVFQHANIRTPRWLGYLVQRPESHAIHHARGLHRRNYSDLPVWDLLFGTFHNPTQAEVDGLEVGFEPGASRRLADLLLLREVSGPAPTGRAAP